MTPWTAAHQASLSFTISRSLLKLMSVELVMPSNHLILYHPLLLLASIFPSIRVFSNQSVLHIRWPKYWSFSFSICLPVNIQDLFPLGWAGLISFPSKGFSRVFSNESALRIRWPKFLSFTFSTVLPMNIQDLFPLGLTGWIFLQSKGLSRVFSNTTVQKHQFFGAQPSL